METEMVLIILNLGQQEKRNEVHKSIYNKNPKWQRLQYMEQTAVCLIDAQWNRNGTGIQNFEERRVFYILQKPLEFLDMKFD